MRARRPLALLAALAAAAALVPAATADGDPASDYLISQPVFLPFDAHVSTGSSNELQALLAASKQKGFEVRVAVIATPYDLGAIPVLFDKPAEYAQFLGQELYYWYKHELLIVMPNGYGVYKIGTPPTADRKAVAALPPPRTTSGSGLVAAASRAVRVLAARRGINLSQVKPAGRPSTGSDRLVIGIATAVVLALAAGFVFVRRRLAARR